jgi:mediator of RNA polymerase II transcription subunit 6
MAWTAEFSEALLMQSLNLTNRYGDEYMDENPLLGEPGAFVFTNTKGAVDARNKASEQAVQAVQPSQPAAAKTVIPPPSVAPSVAPTPKPAPIPAAMDAQGRKGSTATQPKEKRRERRKSKGLASPSTPGPGIPPTS